MRVDYHAAAMPGDLTIKGKVVRMGGQFSTAEASIYDARGQAPRQRPRHLFHRAAAAAEGVRRRSAIDVAHVASHAGMADLHQPRRPDRRDRDLTKLAIIDLGGEEAPREYSYAELDAMTNGVARALAKRGLARGDRIAILSANRAEFIAAYFGIMRAGLVAVPVNYRFPKKTIHFIIAGCRRQARVLRSRAAARTARTDLPAVVFGDEGATASTASSIRANSRP